MILLLLLIPIPQYRKSCLFHLEGNPAFLIFHTDQLKKKKKGKRKTIHRQRNAQNDLKITNCQQPKICSILSERQIIDAQTLREGTQGLPGQEIPTDKGQHTNLCIEIKNTKKCLNTIKHEKEKARNMMK